MREAGLENTNLKIWNSLKWARRRRPTDWQQQGKQRFYKLGIYHLEIWDYKKKSILFVDYILKKT